MSNAMENGAPRSAPLLDRSDERLRDAEGVGGAVRAFLGREREALRELDQVLQRSPGDETAKKLRAAIRCDPARTCLPSPQR